MPSVFVSGLETKSGKTIVTAGLAATMQSLAYSTGVYKPIETSANLSEFMCPEDFEFIKMVDPNITLRSLYSMSGKSSPFVSSYEENVKIEFSKIYSEFQFLQNSSECLLVEGANSISTPVVQSLTEIDIVKTLNIPLLLVVNPSKTTIENVITGLDYIKSNNVKFLGIIITQYDELSEELDYRYFPQIVKEFSGVNILGSLPDYGDLSSLDPGILIADILNRVNIEEIFGLKIAKLEN